MLTSLFQIEKLEDTAPALKEKRNDRVEKVRHNMFAVTLGTTHQYTALRNFYLLPFLFFSFVHLIRFITNLKYATRSGCHMTIITLIHWINIDNLLFTVINELD